MRKACAVALSILMSIGALTGPPATTATAATASAPKASPTRPIRTIPFRVTGAIKTAVARPVILQRKAGSTWVRISTSTTTSRGRYSFTVASSWSSVQLRLVAPKTRIRGHYYSSLVSRVTRVRAVSITPAVPMASEKFTIVESLGTKGSRRAVLQRRVGRKWVGVQKVTSRSNGLATFSIAVSTATALRVVAPRTTIKHKRFRAITVPAFVVKVTKQTAVMSVPSSGVTGQALVAKLQFSPARAGRPVQLQQYQDSRWVSVATGTQDASGRSTLGVSPTTAGTLTVRAVALAYRGAPAAYTSTRQVAVVDGTPKPSVVTSGVPEAVAGEDYSTQLTAVGGTAPLSWSARDIPEGMSLSTDGVLSGVPSAPGSYTIHVTVTDKTSASAEGIVQITVKPVVSIETTSLPNAIAAQDYQATVAGSGGTEGYTWQAKDLPAGLTLADDGTISGTTDETGEHQVTFTITDANKRTATKTLTLTVTAALAITTDALPNASIGAAYETTVKADGGQAPYAWAASGLPKGLTINSSGVISGTPAEAGSFDAATVTVTDDNQYSATRTFTVFVANTLSIQTSSMKTGVVNTPYPTTTLESAGGTPGYHWSSTSLPAGLSLSETGVLSGTPTAEGSTEVTFTVTDGAARTATFTWTFLIAPPLRITTTSLPTGVVGTIYTASVEATDGSGPYTWSAKGLPTGMSISPSTGVISGTPTTPGRFTTATVTATDALGDASQATLPLAVTYRVGNTTDLTSLSASGGTACGITNIGGVKCWGSNTYGQLGDGTTISRSTATPVTDLDAPITSISVGSSFTCAVTTSKTVLCWGSNTYGQLGDGTTTNRATPVTVPNLSDVVAVSVGSSHTCALTSSGDVECWGQGTSGQLGDGNATSSADPVSAQVSGVIGLGSGTNFTCALLKDGTAQCWGANNFKQMGDSSTGHTTPTAVSGITNATSISATFAHTCVVTSTGGVQCWGRNVAGQLGDGSTLTPLHPVTVTGLPGAATSVSAGGSSTCAIIDGGGVSCWGSNSSGQLGDGTTTPSPTPVTAKVPAATQVVAANTSTCALSSTGDVTCWGGNMTGQLGNGHSGNEPSPLAATGYSTPLSSIAAGTSHSCALTTGGTIQCAGSNNSGQLGDGTNLPKASPVTVKDPTGSADLTGVKSVVTSNGGDFTCAISAENGVLCWGQNSSGQLGNGTPEAANTTTSYLPVQVTGLSSGVVAITAGQAHACALTEAGTVKCWGQNFGVLGNGSSADSSYPVDVVNLDHVTAIAAGWVHTCARIDDGTMKCWGNNYYGELGVGNNNSTTGPVSVSSISGVTSMAAGYDYTCAVTNGGLKCWGYNNYGQLGNGTTTDAWTPSDVTGLSSAVQSVSAGSYTACAVSTDGSLRCWGYNNTGQLGVGDFNNRITPTPVAGSDYAAVSTGSSFTCAMTTDSKAHCWGSNSYSQLGVNTTVYLDPQTVLGIRS